ncbi:MAG: aldo/keto reductase [Lachnospiraceae bacterium]|nr:aldo/keto reductase [Lachnospiraceae bacterium]
MQYRKDRYGNPLSVLGYGCMRFSQKNGRPDTKKASMEIMEAFSAGVNYYDTAYTYPGSEEALGEILESLNIRDQVNIATKLPHYLIRKKEDPEKYFREELRRLRTDHVDYYLMHMLTDDATWQRLTDLGIQEWIAARKQAGEIRQIGFSYHGNTDTFMRLLDAYDWDFCQIQYNYMDEFSQAGRAGLMYAAEKGIPVIIMEPLRGGKLVKDLPKEAAALFEKNQASGITPASLAFRWLFDQPQVSCVLSGMNSLEMVRENVKTADSGTPGCFTEEERVLVEDLKAIFHKSIKVPCTGCRYCMPCPHNVDIPGTFSAYNRRYSEGLIGGLKDYFMCTVLRKNPTMASNCVECGLCETHCPQHIEIRKMLKASRKVLENPVVKIAAKIVPHFMKY